MKQPWTQTQTISIPEYEELEWGETTFQLYSPKRPYMYIHYYILDEDSAINPLYGHPDHPIYIHA